MIGTGAALDTPRHGALGHAGINRLLCTPQGFGLIGSSDSAQLDAPALGAPSA